MLVAAYLATEDLLTRWQAEAQPTIATSTNSEALAQEVAQLRKDMAELKEMLRERIGVAPRIADRKINLAALRRRYPEGFAIYASDGVRIASFPVGGWDFKIDPISGATIGLQLDHVLLQIPTFSDGSLNIAGTTVRAPREEGFRAPLFEFEDGVMWLEILINSERGIAWVVGFAGR